jgi:hypothetical protein
MSILYLEIVLLMVATGIGFVLLSFLMFNVIRVFDKFSKIRNRL